MCVYIYMYIHNTYISICIYIYIYIYVIVFIFYNNVLIGLNDPDSPTPIHSRQPMNFGKDIAGTWPLSL